MMKHFFYFLWNSEGNVASSNRIHGTNLMLLLENFIFVWRTIVYLLSFLIHTVSDHGVWNHDSETDILKLSLSNLKEMYDRYFPWRHFLSCITSHITYSFINSRYSNIQRELLHVYSIYQYRWTPKYEYLHNICLSY